LSSKSKQQPSACKPPAVFLVTVKITGSSAADCRDLARRIAAGTEAAFEDKTISGPVRFLHYELNLSKWELL
jgi:hypothetical protein